jgi:hypothetical protein
MALSNYLLLRDKEQATAIKVNISGSYTVRLSSMRWLSAAGVLHAWLAAMKIVAVGLRQADIVGGSVPS